MGFHKRYISNDQVIEIYKESGITKVYDWYTKGVDALITETGLASEIGDLLNSENYFDKDKISNKIENEIKI
mgnify:CR=1 FL=1|tara:strand:+ start:1069 stop:1284 length:216 start_codon:yes stop_codon:yes gene_type:complete